jgi:hypothetical protein
MHQKKRNGRDDKYRKDSQNDSLNDISSHFRTPFFLFYFNAIAYYLSFYLEFRGQSMHNHDIQPNT